MKEKIRELALSMGFTACGFTTTQEIDGASGRLKSWLERGFNADMGYMANHFEMRTNPSILVENSKTVISLLFNYYPQELQRVDSYKIAKYAYGKDYHKVFKGRIQELFDRVNSEISPIRGRVFTDSAPLMERELAVRAGLGWIGKNSLLVTKEFG